MSNLFELPAGAQRLVDLIGYDAAVRLIEGYGGTRIYVPKTPTETLINLLGQEAAAKLSDAYPIGGDLAVPLCPQIKRTAAVNLYRQGVSAAEIARYLRTTEKSIYAWVKRAEAQRYQAQNGDLFGDAMP